MLSFALLSVLISGDAARESPSALVDKALRAEVAGNLTQRDSLLRDALAANPAPKLHWQLGKTLIDGEWRAARDYTGSPSPAEYLQRRKRSADTAAGHWLLAKWCKSRGYTREFLAEAAITARLAPQMADAQKALGKSFQEGRWATAEEHLARGAERRRALAVQERWTKTLKALPVPPKTLPTIDDPAAIPMLEQLVSRRSEEGAALAVRELSRTKFPAAAQSLVRHAVWSHWESVRTAAVASLKVRPLEETVPALIAMLRPDASGTRFIQGLGEIWFWQDQTHDYVAIPQSLRNGRDRTAVPQATVDRSQSLLALVRSDPNRSSPVDEDATNLDRQIQTIEFLNQQRTTRAADVLATLTAQPRNEQYDVWRRWWTSTQDRFVDDATDPQPARDLVTQTYSDQQITSVAVRDSPVISSHSCFAAGTLVGTAQGLRPIDQIELGDFVLSQSVVTGELAYKPVVFRTLIPRQPMRLLNVGSETIRATRIHPFWLVGEGWKKAKELSQGSKLRTMDGIVQLRSAEEGEPAQAYNLEVADFGTYFVGRAGLLVHDNTAIPERQPKAPGLTIEETK